MSRLLFVALVVVLFVPLFGVAEANPGTPDLQITDVSVTVPDPAQPNRVYIEVSVANHGDAPAGAFAIRWYPHQASNEVGCSTNVPGLDAGKRGKSRCYHTYVDNGQMHWRAVVDEEADVAESNEDNNTQTGTITIGAPSASPDAGYDLYVRRMDFSPLPHTTGTPIQMWPMIATDSAPEGQPPFPVTGFRWRKGPNFPWQPEVCAADIHIASCLTQVEFSYDLPGTYVVEVQADYLSSVVETDETNNTRTYTLNVTGPEEFGSGDTADLLILYPRFEPSPVIQGQPFDAVMVVRNGGAEMAAGPFIARWDFPDGLGIEDCVWEFSELAAFSAATLSCERTTNKKGQASTSLTVDADNVVPEPDEVNNDVTVPMTISPSPSGQPEASGTKPDLVIEDAHFEPSHPLPGQPFKALMSVRNNSSVDVTRPFRALWEFEAALGVNDCEWEFGGGLPANAKATARCERTSNANPGHFPTLPTVDADNVIAERDEVNNDHPITLILYATDTPDGQGPTMPDFMIENLQVTPNPATPGQRLTVSFDVVNWGTAAPASEARWHSGDPNQQAINRDVPALATGASYHVELSNVTAPNVPGSYVHTATAESRCLIDEESETNNRMLGNDAIGTDSLVVVEQVWDHPDPSGPPADLIVRNLDISPNPVAPGQDMLIEFEVVNQGSTVAPASVATWRTPPGAGLSFRCDVPVLLPGAISRCSRQFAAPPRKNYGTTARADVDNTVDEGNREDNNSVKVTLRVQ